MRYFYRNPCTLGGTFESFKEIPPFFQFFSNLFKTIWIRFVIMASNIIKIIIIKIKYIKWMWSLSFLFPTHFHDKPTNILIYTFQVRCVINKQESADVNIYVGNLYKRRQQNTVRFSLNCYFILYLCERETVVRIRND